MTTSVRYLCACERARVCACVCVSICSRARLAACSAWVPLRTPQAALPRQLLEEDKAEHLRVLRLKHYLDADANTTTISRVLSKLQHWCAPAMAHSARS